MAESKKTIRCALVGCGGMARAHVRNITGTPGLELAAGCETNPGRREQAQADFPQIPIYPSLAGMLAEGDFDLAIIVVPHNLHTRLALQCLQAGKHVIVEKPMCFTTRDATSMIELAKQKKVMLSVYHQRRWDPDYLALRKIIARGKIGRLFQIEAMCGGCGRGDPHNWRFLKEASGGLIWDWGAHFADWILGLSASADPPKARQEGGMTEVFCQFRTRPRPDVFNEDHAFIVVRFASGALASWEVSSIARVGKPRWRILGTEGAIVVPGTGPNSIRLVTSLNGLPADGEIKYQEHPNWPEYSRNIAAHLLEGEPLAVTAESARRVVSLLEAAEKSARIGRPVRPAFA